VFGSVGGRASPDELLFRSEFLGQDFRTGNCQPTGYLGTSNLQIACVRGCPETVAFGIG
jgi:hypothetical protein